jgi:DNA-binding transcriptional regulator YiaG
MAGMAEKRAPYGRRTAHGSTWDGEGLRALRQHMGLTQQALAEELGVRQQTVSEWETGMYRPRGASSRLLTLVAERTGFQYVARSASTPDASQPSGEQER